MVMGQVLFPYAAPLLPRVGRGKYLRPGSLPRVSTAVVRVPDPQNATLPVVFPAGKPQIFVHEGVRQALERRLAQARKRPVVLSVTDNRRSMIALSDRDGVVRARLHHMFLDAPRSVQDALVRYLVRQDRDASLVVGQYIEQHGHRIRAHRAVVTPLVTVGKHHDLLPLFHKLNAAYFGGIVDARVTWGRRRRSAGARRTIKLGSYSAAERLIRIHPNLDRPWVPRYFVGMVLFHEMLHHVMPASHGPGPRMLHPPEFRDRERAYRHFERSNTWERLHIARLLKA